MANRNIQMKKKSGDTWDNLYPITLGTNVFNENGISVSEQLAQTEQDIEKIKNKINRVKFSELQEPIYISHRGGANIFPENTLEAYEGCISMGENIIELDVQQLADGTLAVMHDLTMDRTTNRTGYVKNYSTMGFKRAKVDILHGWDDVHPPLFEEVLSRFGNNAIYIIESKDQKSAKKIADTLKRYRLEEYACIQSFILADLQEVTNEGIPLMYLSDSANPQQVKSNNIDYIGVSTSASESYIQSCISAGLKVFVYTVNRRYERDYFLNLGVSGFFTDEPLYVQGKSPVLTKDPFAEQVFTHGMFSPPRNVDFDNSGKRGEFVAPNKFGWPTPETSYLRDFCLQGWAGVLPDSFTLTAKMTLQASVQQDYWGSIAFCTQKDIWNDSSLSDLSEGYHVLLREDGRLRLYRRDGTTPTLLNEITTPAWTQGQTANIEIVVTASQITVRRDSSSFTVNDTKYRNGYLHLGRRVSGVLFHDIYIT